MDVVSVAQSLLEYFESRSQRVAVIGGYALLAHGVGRATFDLDLMVENESQDDLIAFLESKGYETLHRSSGYSNHLHAHADLGRLDFIYVDRDTADQIFESGKRMEILEGIEAMVPSPEHLVALKVHAIRNDPSRKLQDLTDVQRILRENLADPVVVRELFNKAGLSHLYRDLEHENQE